MALIKNTLLFGGWIPTLLGGAGGVWWLTSDKTVEDALRRTSLRFLHSKEDFERVYEQFEDDPNLLKDIPQVATLKGKAIDEWCDDKLQLSLSEENIKDVITKATRYCMGSERILSGLFQFRKFDNIANAFGNGKLNLSNMKGFVMAHLGDEKSKDVYYVFKGGEDLKKEGAWTIINTSRERAFEKKLYIDESYEIIGTKHTNDFKVLQQQDTAWRKKADEYNKAPKNERIPGLNNALEEKYDPRKVIPGKTDGIQRNNLLRVHCMELINKRFTDEKELKEAEKHFTRWCANKRLGK